MSVALVCYQLPNAHDIQAELEALEVANKAATPVYLHLRSGESRLINPTKAPLKNGTGECPPDFMQNPYPEQQVIDKSGIRMSAKLSGIERDKAIQRFKVETQRFIEFLEKN